MRAYRKVKEHYELRIDGSRLALLGVGAGLVMVLVFLLGVLVGKSLWGGRRPAPLPVAEAPQGRPETPLPEAPNGRRPDLSFYDDLRKPDAPSDERPPEAPPPAPVGETPVPIRTEARAAPTTEPAPPTPATPAEAAPKPQPKPRALLPAPVFTVQVGSFRDRSSAEDLVRRVAAQGITAQIVPASVGGRTWYRVQVGRFDTRAEADALYRKTLQPNNVQGFVTTR